MGVNLRLQIPLLQQKQQDFIPLKKSKIASKYKYVFPTNEWLLHTFYGIALPHSWFEIMEFSQILIIPAFWHWKMAA